jgi:hypothetical protein
VGLLCMTGIVMFCSLVWAPVYCGVSELRYREVELRHTELTDLTPRIDVAWYTLTNVSEDVPYQSSRSSETSTNL